ncbi:MAG: PKD domain-containing protein [Solirubrobacterales bacterium]
MHKARTQARSLAAAAAIAAAGTFAMAPAPAQALITPPLTVDGPSSEILDFGGVAMASDGTGGLVYTKAVEGIPHVFASRYGDGGWSAPVRVDWDQPYEASQPRIAAGPGGELLVVWVTEVATVHGQIQRGLYSASIGAGATGFGPSLLVDPNVGEGIGVDPSLSGTAPGQAIVAYRVITYNFNQNGFSTAVQLRPGDVMADIRVARLVGERWSRLGAINRNPEASMRPPSETNGPQAGAGTDGNAVVVWQEPDQTGTARIWIRRIFGTTPGPVLEVSPSSWEGAQVTGDADAFALALTPLGQARVAFRIAASGSTGPRLFLNSLPPDYAGQAASLSGPALVYRGGGALGPPGVSATEKGGQQGGLRLAFASGSQVHQVSVDASGALTALSTPPGPPVQPGAETITALDPEGGGVLAYPALDTQGQPVAAVRQEFASGAAQTGLLSGTSVGPVGELSVGRSGGGDALIGFRQGEAGHYEIVAERVSAPPASFTVGAPKGWVRPDRALLRWQPAPSAVGGLSYAVVIDGRIAQRGLSGFRYRLRPAMLGDGVLRVQVLATDGLGEELLSPTDKLRVDGLPPSVALRVIRARGFVALRLRDPDSGLRTGSTRISFGDGTRARGGSSFRHTYAHAGRYTVRVSAVDKVGNRVRRHFVVAVR